MNTTPDNHDIHLWLEDELDSPAARSIETWATTHASDLLEKRNAIRAWKNGLRQVIPAAEEPPYPDFFQSKLLRAIESKPAVTPPVRTESSWKKWLLPTFSAAACAIAFYAGSQWNATPPAKALVTYTPEEGVQAEYFVSSPSDATVIVLNGVEPLPDSLTSRDTASHRSNTDDEETQSASIVAP